MTPPSRNDIAALTLRRSSWHWLGVAVVICFAAVRSTRAGTSAESGADGISVSWELLENVVDGHFNCALTLRNKGTVALSEDWSLYFNSASKLELAADDVTSQTEAFLEASARVGSLPMAWARRVIHW